MKIKNEFQENKEEKEKKFLKQVMMKNRKIHTFLLRRRRENII